MPISAARRRRLRHDLARVARLARRDGGALVEATTIATAATTLRRRHRDGKLVDATR